jgi:iron complex outermembrane receptor protein
VTNQNLDPANERLIRGFTAETYRDGLPLSFSAGDRESLANVERIEVLKGPSALLYAGGIGAPIGGLINLVQKHPEPTASYAGGITVGSYGYAAGTIDVNQPLNQSKTVLTRLTAEVGRSNSYIDTIQSKRGSIDPTIAFTNGHGTTLTVHGRWSQRVQNDYSGLPLPGTITAAPYSIDRNFYPGYEDDPVVNSLVIGGDVTFEQELGEHWKLTVPAQVSRSVYEQYGQYLYDITAFGAPPPTYGWGSAFVSRDLHEVSVTPTVSGTFDVAASHNRVVFGGDYNVTTDRGIMTGSSAFDTVDITNFQPTPYATQDISFYDAANRYRTTAVFGQVQSTLYERVTLVGGARLIRLQREESDKAFSGDEDAAGSKVVPRFGASVALTQWLSTFAGYGEGYRAVPYARTKEAKPESSRQVEAGFKAVDQELVTATLAAFELHRTNVAAPDPAGGPVQVQIGEQRSRGIEADIALTPGEHWSLLANYALTDAVITDNGADTSHLEGNHVAAVPRHAGRVWARYAFGPDLLQGFSLGSGITAIGRREVDNAETAQVPGYLTVDASAQYQWREYTAALTAKNLTNTQYWDPYVYLIDPMVVPGAPVTVLASLEARF